MAESNESSQPLPSTTTNPRPGGLTLLAVRPNLRRSTRIATPTALTIRITPHQSINRSTPTAAPAPTHPTNPSTPIASPVLTHQVNGSSSPLSSPPPLTSSPSPPATPRNHDTRNDDIYGSSPLPFTPQGTPFLHAHTPHGNAFDAHYLTSRFRLAVRIWIGVRPSGVQIARLEFEDAATAERVFEQQGGEGGGTAMVYSLYTEEEGGDRWWEGEGVVFTEVKEYNRTERSW